jgi:hypothetical protein
VGFVVLGVEQLAGVAQLVPQLPVQVELVFDPEGAGHEEGLEACRRDPQIGLQDALELEQRLVVEPDVSQIPNLDSRLRQTVRHSLSREGGIPLLPGKPFLLGRGHDLAVPEQTCGAVVVVCGYAKYVRTHTLAPSAATAVTGASREKNSH